MSQNIYDNPAFFCKYSQMTRSQKGLEGAGEWGTLRALLPSFQGKRVLDLGCGYGWHCAYAMEQGAQSVVGIDCSERMLARARELTQAYPVTYQQVSIEEYEYPEGCFDVVLSSLALHYVPSFEAVCEKVWQCLAPGGDFVFSVEHPIFTAQGPQEWALDASGSPLHWPVDRYFEEGARSARFLDETVTKQHRTLTSYVNGLLAQGFTLTGLREPQPAGDMLAHPGMRDELRRPMMLIVAAKKDGRSLS